MVSAAPRMVVTGLIGLFVAIGLLGAVAVLGPLAAIVVLTGGVIGLILLADARRTVLLAVGLLILVESNRSWGIEAAYQFWQPRFAQTGAMDLLLYAAYGATLLLVVRRGSVRLPTPFTAPLLGFGVLLLAGTAWSVLGGTAVRYQLISTFQTFVPALLIPFVLVNVIDHGTDLRRVLTGGAGLAALKALSGLFVVFTGLSAAAGNDPGLTFYEPAGNLFLLAFLLTVVAALASRVPLSIWMRLVGVLAFLSLLFAFRRTFWLAGVLCIVLVLLAASGRVGRRLAIPAAFLVAGAVFLGLQSGVASDPSGALATRVQSIDPSKVVRNDQDRYRLTERRNVLAELRAHPLTGVGVGVEWKQRYPLNFEVTDLQYYSHTAVLWHWLKYGAMGPLMYLWLIVAAALSGLRIFRRSTDRVVACAGLGAGAALIGLAVVELASTVIGPDLRGGMVAGVLLGLLAVAERGLGVPAAADPTVRLAAA